MCCFERCRYFRPYCYYYRFDGCGRYGRFDNFGYDRFDDRFDRCRNKDEDRF